MMQAWEPAYVEALLKYGDIRRASKAIGIDRTMALHSFYSDEFCAHLEQRHFEEVGKAINTAREARDRMNALGVKSSSDRSAINRIDKSIRDLITRQSQSTRELFPELTEVLGPRWKVR